MAQFLAGAGNKTSLFVKSVLASSDERCLQFLEQKKSIHFYQKRQVLFYEGNPITGIYSIQSGRMKVYKIGREGKHHILNIAEQGEILGLESLFASDHYTSTAEVIEEGAAGFIDKNTLLETLEKFPQTALKVIKILAKEILNSEEERLDLAQSSVRERMARLLALLSERHGVQNSHGICIKLKLSREEMAEMIGTATETAMRLLKEFREEKVIELDGKSIIILDRKRLIQTSNQEQDSV